MLSSGTTAKATSGNDAITLIEVDRHTTVNEITILNEGSVAGLFSIDGGTTYARLPADMALTIPLISALLIHSVLVKRIPDGSDLTDLWGFAH